MSVLIESFEYTEDDISKAAAVILPHITKKPFTLWLVGPLGAGKTTLTRALLRALGLSPEVPVRSPTYTLMNELKVKDRWYAHLDLYRLPAESDMSDLGLFGNKDFAGIFVEWPDIVSDSAAIDPTHKLHITIVDEMRRQLRLEAV